MEVNKLKANKMKAMDLIYIYHDLKEPGALDDDGPSLWTKVRIQKNQLGGVS